MVWGLGSGGFLKLRLLFQGSHNKDCTKPVLILGSPYFGKLPYRSMGRAFMLTKRTYGREVGAR